MIPRPGRAAKSFAPAGALCALLSVLPAHAQGMLTVSSPAPSVSAGGALYNYFYVVNYTSPDGGLTDLAFVEFQAAPNAQLSNLGASPGFVVNYDSTLGFVTFLEDFDQTTPQTFSSGPVSFSFSSPYAPATVAYDATDFPTAYAGTLLAPAVAPAPEPGALVSLGAGALGLTLLAARRRRASAS